MLPELAAAYVVGAASSGAVLALHSYTVSKRFRSKKMRTLQNNLARVGLYWSERASQTQPQREGAIEDERRGYLRDLLAFGVIGVFLSWVGFFFHLLIFISLRYLAVPRLERALFSSRLAQEEMKISEIEDELSRLRETYRAGI